MDLLFERFLSKSAGGPDIDLDCERDRRERVISTCTRNTAARRRHDGQCISYRGRSAAREVGKALGRSAHIDRLAKVMHRFEFVDPDDTLARQLAEVGSICRWTSSIIPRRLGTRWGSARHLGHIRRNGDLSGTAHPSCPRKCQQPGRVVSSGTKTTAPTWLVKLIYSASA